MADDWYLWLNVTTLKADRDHL